MPVKSIKIDTLPKKMALLAMMATVLIGIVFFIRWCTGNVLASHTIYSEVADLAVSLAPGDPQTHYTSAVLSERRFTPDEVAKSIAEYEQAVALSPNDYRTWLALGKARERSEDITGAELALRKSRELAPNYSEVSWRLGNFLLRQGKTAEAFAELRKAAESDTNFVNPTVSTAWQMFDGNLSQISQYLGGSPAVTSAFITYLVKENRIEDALAIWNSLSAEDKKTNFKDKGTELFNSMIQQRKYRDALQIHSQITDVDAAGFAVGKLFNGDFESEVKLGNANIFEWQIQDGGQPQIVIDGAQKHGGGRSLAVVYNSPTGRDFRLVSQTVAIEPTKKYFFELFYKSELKTAATLYWEIVGDGKVLAATPAIAAASPGWTNMKVEFVAPEKTDVIIIRLAREKCKSSLCPISGRAWFDDLTITQ